MDGQVRDEKGNEQGPAEKYSTAPEPQPEPPKAPIGESEAEQAAPASTVTRAKLTEVAIRNRALSEACLRIRDLCDQIPGLDADLALAFGIKPVA